MSVLPDFNLMDMLFDRDGQSKIDDIKVDDKHSFDNFSSWDNNASIPGINGVDFLDSILFNQNLNDLDLLPSTDGEEFLSNTLANSVIGSSCSDSGVSSDQQMSPESFQDNSDELDFQSIVKTEDLVELPPLPGYPQQTVICGQPPSPGVVDTFDSPIDVDGEEIEIKAEDVDDVEVDDVEVDVEELIEEAPLQQTYTRPVVRVKPVSPVSRGSIHRSHLVSPRSPPSTTRQILIPLKGRKSLKTIKIIKAVGGQVHQQQRIQRYEESRSSSEDDSGDEADSMPSKNNLYPRLQLSEEEKRLMVKEGVSLPTHYPLTKQEERDLKRIRRKIRNKISAQDSRKRKKEYVDGLEDRVKQCSAENASLLKKMKALQSENQSLSAQLRRLQAVIARNGTNQTQPATCLMVLVLSLALIMAPNMRPTSRSVTNSDLGIPDTKSSPIVPGRTRAILEAAQPAKTLEGGFQDIPIDGTSETAMFEDEDSKQGILSELAEMLHFRLTPSQLDHDYTSHRHRKRSRSYVVPPVDDKWPPPKRPHLNADPPPPPIRPSGRPTIRSFATIEPKNRTGVPSPSNIVEIELTSSDDGF